MVSLSTTSAIAIDRLFEFTIAALLQDSGYVAGVPVRRLGGRGTTHQVDAVGIEFKQVPFAYDTILIAEAKCYEATKSVGVQTVRALKSILIDLEQTLPPRLNIIPKGKDPGWYFHSLLGNRSGENLTVHYRGAIFSTKIFSHWAREFAYSHGIFLFTFPDFVAGKSVIDWMKILLSRLESMKEKGIPENILRRLDLQKYLPVLRKLFSQGFGELTPLERHRLFRIVSNTLRFDPELQSFWSFVRWYRIVDINGYPVLANIEISPAILIRDVLEHYSSVAGKKYRGLALRHKFSLLRLQIYATEGVKDEEFVQASFRIHDNEKMILSGNIILPRLIHEKGGLDGLVFSMPMRSGLFLVAQMEGAGRKGQVGKYHWRARFMLETKQRNRGE